MNREQELRKVEKWIKNKNKEDIKNEINPLYSIKIGSSYQSKEMFRDVEELMIAIGQTFFEKGILTQKKDEARFLLKNLYNGLKSSEIKERIKQLEEDLK